MTLLMLISTFFVNTVTSINLPYLFTSDAMNTGHVKMPMNPICSQHAIDGTHGPPLCLKWVEERKEAEAQVAQELSALNCPATNQNIASNITRKRPKNPSTRRRDI